MNAWSLILTAITVCHGNYLRVELEYEDNCGVKESCFCDNCTRVSCDKGTNFNAFWFSGGVELFYGNIGIPNFPYNMTCQGSGRPTQQLYWYHFDSDTVCDGNAGKPCSKNYGPYTVLENSIIRVDASSKSVCNKPTFIGSDYVRVTYSNYNCNTYSFKFPVFELVEGDL